ncbi:hypothetical protein PR002_g4927 [Phytophthora rubi]|uniref:Uncharacterized protein n=1 Tax=Phytophthora rubi TaxID=129364 RepID=A0A6A3N4Z3_9STRA|nr:hypothetical protein PR002_g4927 [Phytophthora rubi]
MDTDTPVAVVATGTESAMAVGVLLSSLKVVPPPALVVDVFAASRSSPVDVAAPPPIVNEMDADKSLVVESVVVVPVAVVSNTEDAKDVTMLPAASATSATALCVSSKVMRRLGGAGAA